MKRGLSFAHVQMLLAQVPDMKDAVLVGGQALNHWAEQFRIADFGLALSFDIDFLGGGAAAEEIARAVGGRARIAGLTDPHSPNTALVTATIDGVEHHIDFLGSLHGFSMSELQRVRDWAVEVHPQAGGPPIRVMHPVHCLQSVLANTFGATLDRRRGPAGARAAERVKLAVAACRSITLEYLEQRRDRDALRIAERVHAMSVSQPALRAEHEDGIEVADAVPVDRMPTAFRERRWPQLVREREIDERKYARLRERRAAIAAKKKR